MTEKQLRKLKRSDLLEIMMEQAQKIEEQNQELETVRRELANRTMKLENSGSIAEASLALNDVFESAQAAADAYLASIHENQIESERALERAHDEAEEIIQRAKEHAEDIENDAKQRLADMVSEAVDQMMREKGSGTQSQEGGRRGIRFWRRNG